MKNLLFLLPLCFVLSCEPQGFPDLTLANLNGKWEGTSYGQVSQPMGPRESLELQNFEIAFEEDNQFVISGLGGQSYSGTWAKADKAKLNLSVPGNVVRANFAPLDICFYMIENRQDRQEWQANGQQIIDNQVWNYDLSWYLDRIE
ncbi:MAG: hypothetical protein AAFN10_02725 [Bacteroidota bacterium]